MATTSTDPYAGLMLTSAIGFGVAGTVSRMRARYLPQSGPPVEGQETLPGWALKIRPPSMPDFGNVWAVTADPRFRDPALYHLFEPFLPEGFSVVGAPTVQNCFAHVLGVNEHIEGPEFDDRFSELDRDVISKDFEPGDVVVYYCRGENEQGDQVIFPNHAGIVRPDGLVESRLGMKAPLVSHPINAPVIMRLYTGYGGHFTVFRIYRSEP